MDDSWASTNISRIMSFDRDDFEDDFISTTSVSRQNCGDLEPFFEDDEMSPRENFTFQQFVDRDADVVSESGWSEASKATHSPRYVARHRPDFEPIEEKVLKCLSIQVLALAHDSWELTKCIASDAIFDIDKDASAPTISEVEDLFAVLHARLHIEYEIALISLIYIKRLCKDTSSSIDSSTAAGASENLQLKMSPYNWRAVVIVCVRLATKIWDDYHILNRDFVDPFLEIMDLKLLMALELRTLEALDFQLEVAESVFQNLHSVIKVHYSCLARGDREESVLEAAQSGVVDLDRLSPPPGPSPLTPSGTASAGAPAINKFSKGWSWKRSRSNKVVAVDCSWDESSDVLGASSESPSPSKSLSKSPNEGGGMRLLLGRSGSNRVVVEPGS